MQLFEIDNEITLKQLDENDAPTLFLLTDNSRDSLREWLPWVDKTKNIADTKAFIEQTQHLFIDRKGLTTGIIYNGQLVGVVGFNAFDWTNQIGSIGYWLGTDFQGNGIMTRAVKGLITYGIESLGLNRIDIRAAEGNYKSRSIPKRLGFVEEGRLRQTEWLYDHYVNHIVYGMLADEWKNQHRKLNLNQPGFTRK